MIVSCYRHKQIPGWDGNHTPACGKWFPVIKDLISHYATLDDVTGKVCIAWDKNDNGCKAFGVFNSGYDYFDTIQHMPPSKRSGYEIILRDRPCKLYLDVEWETPGMQDEGATQKVEEICLAITCKMREKYPEHGDEEIDFYISTCSRLKNTTVYKNSFHIVANNIIFHNNHSGDMEYFVRALGFVDEIDTAVYTPNRCVRTELASKFGQNAFFRNTLEIPAGDTKTQSLIKSLITIFDSTLPVLPENQHKIGKSMKKRKVRDPDAVSGDGKSRVPREISENKTLKIPQYFLELFDNEVNTVFEVQRIDDQGNFSYPLVVRELLNHNCVGLSDVWFIYIKHAKCCVNKFLCDISHAHHSNNSCAVAVNINGRLDIYTRCYGCPKDQKMCSINKFDEKYHLLPSLTKNTVLHRIMHTKYGIQNVCDSEDRLRILKIYTQKREFEINELLVYKPSTIASQANCYSKSTAYLWHKYVTSAAFGWLFISEKKYATQVPS
jgi:hypothetical protein